MHLKMWMLSRVNLHCQVTMLDYCSGNWRNNCSGNLRNNCSGNWRNYCSGNWSNNCSGNWRSYKVGLVEQRSVWPRLQVFIFFCIFFYRGYRFLFFTHYFTNGFKKQKLHFLSDPGVPGVRSMGPVLSHSQTELPLCRLNWCDSGWWRYQLNTGW